jgi:fatty acid-binding protein DegV
MSWAERGKVNQIGIGYERKLSICFAVEKAKLKLLRLATSAVRTLQRWINEAQEKVKQQGDLVAVVAETLSPESDSVVERLFSQDFFQRLDTLMPSCLQELESILNDPDSRKQDKIRVCQL